MLLKLAWRNIWRNSRRSVIILTSIVVGMAAIIFMESLSVGFLKQMFENQLGSHTAHIQINKRGFNDNKVIQEYVPDPARAEAVLASHPHVAHYGRRVIAFGLLSSASNSSGVSIIGITPSDEAKITTIQRSVIEGRYLSGEKHEVLISRRLAGTLGVGLGDRLVAMASDVNGRVGSDMFRVVGLYETFSSTFDRAYIYISLENAQEMLQLGGNVSQFALIGYDINTIAQVKADLREALGEDYEVLSYHDLLPLLIAQMEISEQSVFIFYLIVGLAMIFGIINTMLMSVFERINEFGVLKAVGMRNRRLFGMIVLEAFFLGLLGTAIGAVAGIGVTLPLSASGLDFSAFSEGLAAWGAGAIVYPILRLSGLVSAVLVILVVCIVAAMYPAYRAVRLEPMNAIRYV